MRVGSMRLRHGLPVGSEECLGSKCEGGTLDEAAFHNIDAHQFDTARAFREGARDIFMVDDDVAHDLTPNQLGVEMRLRETWRGARTDLRMAFGELHTAKLKLSCIRRIGAEPSVQVFGVVRVQLTLHDDFRGCVFWHWTGLMAQMVGDVTAGKATGTAPQ